MTYRQQFAQYINPLLTVLRDLGGSAKSAEAKSAVAEHLGLSDDVLEDRLKSGSSRFENQVSWARYYLVRGGFIDSSHRGVWTLTEKGRNTNKLSESAINDLIDDVVAKWGKKTEDDSSTVGVGDEEQIPDEVEGDYRTRLLDVLQDLPPAGFE